MTSEEIDIGIIDYVNSVKTRAQNDYVDEAEIRHLRLTPYDKLHRVATLA